DSKHTVNKDSIASGRRKINRIAGATVGQVSGALGRNVLEQAAEKTYRSPASLRPIPLFLNNLTLFYVERELYPRAGFSTDYLPPSLWDCFAPALLFT